VFDNGILVDGSTSPAEIQVILRTDGASIEGTVIDRERKPVERAFVVLVPEASRRVNPLRFKTGFADSSGHFTMNDVSPDQYKVFAWTALLDMPPSAAFRSESFIAKVEDRGVRVSATAGGKSTVQVRLIQD
jgi:hypothetical protein